MTLKYSFKINGTEIGDPTLAGTGYVLEGTKISLSRDNTEGNMATIRVAVSVLDVITPTAGMSVVISRGETTAFDYVKFRGNVKQISENEGVIILKCMGELNKLKYDLFVEQYDKDIDPEAGEVSAIFTDIAEQGGFTVDAISSGTGLTDITISRFVCNRLSRLNRMNLLSKILNWYFYYDYDAEEIKFQPKGYETYTNALIVGDNVYNVPIWEEDIESMRNNITVIGAYELDTRQEKFSGDTVETEFDLTWTPEGTQVSVDGVLLERGIEDQTTDYDYTVDKGLKKLIFVNPPANGTNNIIIDYEIQLPRPVQGTEPSSISQYGLTQEEKYEFKDVVKIEDAQVRLSQLLDLLSFGIVNTTLFTNEADIREGMKVSVVDSNNSTRNGEYIVLEVVINYPTAYDIIKIGTPKLKVSDIYSTIDERLKLLETGDTLLDEILRQLIKLSQTISIRRDSLEIESRTINPLKVWGHPLAIWGSGVWGDAGTTSFTQTYYKEY